MSFLQPLLLAGLPLIGLPILIHLIHRQRHRTVPWAAMMFLIDAERLTRGTARLRYWLIMAMRMLAVAALLFALARPLASGWFGLTVGGQPDTTIFILDRSASMEQQDMATGHSKRSTGLDKLAQLASTLGAGTQIVLIENTENRAQHLESPDEFLTSAMTSATATTADIPGMLQTALDYVLANQAGSTDIWICSDLRENDWNPDDGRWTAVRDGFAELDGVRFYLLSYAETARENVAVQVSRVQRRSLGKDSELVLDVELRRESDSMRPLKVPLEIVINGARSVVNVEMPEREFTLQGHAVGLDETAVKGWGYVQLPMDENMQDNQSYFAFADPPEHRTVIVSDDRRAAEPMRLAAVSPADPAIGYAAEILPPAAAGEINWEATSLVLWQARLPDETVADQLLHFVERGKPVICFPPESPGDGQLVGVSWGAWRGAERGESVPVSNWRGDSDLLAHTRGGSALPVGELRTYRTCPPEGDVGALAALDDGSPLLAHVTASGGPLYFCSTLPRADCSSLAQDGVVFYVMIQRALAIGAATQGNARQLLAGTSGARPLADWLPLSEEAKARSSTARPFVAGAFQEDERLAALNRPPEEDGSAVLDTQRLERILQGLDYRRVEDRVGSSSALVSEIWRAFLLVMALALLVEAALCFPEPRRATEPGVSEGLASHG